MSYLGEEEVRERVEVESDYGAHPRGLAQCDDLDWTLYYLDIGRLDK